MAAANVYNNSKVSSYDSHVSSLGMRFFNNLGVLDLNPINPEFIGEQPKKGDKVYNYDEKLSLYITPQLAHLTASGIKQLRSLIESGLDDDSIKSFTANSAGNAITIYAPGTVVVRAAKKVVDTDNNFVLSIKNKDNETANHILQNDVVQYNTTNKDVLEDIVYTGLDLLEAFLVQCIELSLYGGVQAAAIANADNRGGSGGSTAKKGGMFANLGDDEDDEDDELESKPVPKRKSKSKALSEIEDEFADEE